MRYKKFNGFSLLEVLVSLFLLSVVLLGLEGMQFFALREMRNAWLLSVAVNQINNMSERLRAYGQDVVIEDQVIIWNQEISQLLPKGRGDVMGQYPAYTISLCQQSQIKEEGCISQKIQL